MIEEHLIVVPVYSPPPGLTLAKQPIPTNGWFIVDFITSTTIVPHACTSIPLMFVLSAFFSIFQIILWMVLSSHGMMLIVLVYSSKMGHHMLLETLDKWHSRCSPPDIKRTSQRSALYCIHADMDCLPQFFLIRQIGPCLGSWEPYSATRLGINFFKHYSTLPHPVSLWCY